MALVIFWAACVLCNAVVTTTARATRSRADGITGFRASLLLSFGSSASARGLSLSRLSTLRIAQGNAIAACLLDHLNCLVGCLQQWVKYFKFYDFSVIPVIMMVIDGVATTIFFLFANTPHSLAQSHKTTRNLLPASWKTIFRTSTRTPRRVRTTTASRRVQAE